MHDMPIGPGRHALLVPWSLAGQGPHLPDPIFSLLSYPISLDDTHDCVVHAVKVIYQRAERGSVHSTRCLCPLQAITEV